MKLSAQKNPFTPDCTAFHGLLASWALYFFRSITEQISTDFHRLPEFHTKKLRLYGSLKCPRKKIVEKKLSDHQSKLIKV